MNTRNRDREASVVLTLFGILYTMTFGNALGQRTSLEASADPRITAMGESFVAVPAYGGAMTSNPAGLAGIEGISISYGQLNESESYAQGSRYLSLKGAMHTPFVDIGLSYTRYNYGEPLTRTAYLDGLGREFNPYEYTIGIGIAKQIGSFSIGASVKRFDRSGAYYQDALHKTTVTKPMLFDLGVQYTHGFSSNDDPPNQRISIGVCYQNVGEDIKTETVFSQQPSMRYTTTTGLPQYLRVGLAYQFQTRAEIDGRLMPFRFMIAFEYRNQANAKRSAGRDYWGLGVEGIVYEIVSIRLSQYGYREESFARIGAGLCAPLRKLGADLPMSVRFEYAAMVNDPFINGGHLFSLGLQLHQEVF